jgi:hypothetical protein
MFERYAGVIETTDEEVQRLASNERFVHFAGTIIPLRVGVRLFLVKLEYFYFEPGTFRNDEFIFHVIDWQDMSWAVVSIPKEYLELARGVAAEAGLRVVDGVPHAITAGQVYVFPMNTKNLFTLENVSGHEVYSSNDERITELFFEESQKIKEIFDKHKSSSNN